MDAIEKILNELTDRYSALLESSFEILKTFQVIQKTFENNGTLLICGNGGSACDADHIAGELMKGFAKKRPLSDSLINEIIKIDPSRASLLAMKLQCGLPAIPLTSHAAVISAVANDNDAKLIFAQQVLALGKKGDVLLGISTSGNAENVICAMVTAKAMGMTTVGLTGPTGGAMKPFCDVLIHVPGETTSSIQELHLPVYHAICKMLEEAFYEV